MSSKRKGRDEKGTLIALNYKILRLSIPTLTLYPRQWRVPWPCWERICRGFSSSRWSRWGAGRWSHGWRDRPEPCPCTCPGRWEPHRCCQWRWTSQLWGTWCPLVCTCFFVFVFVFVFFFCFFLFVCFFVFVFFCFFFFFFCFFFLGGGGVNDVQYHWSMYNEKKSNFRRFFPKSDK